MTLFGDKLIKVVHISDSPDILICRPSKWGNPFTHKNNTLAKYKLSIKDDVIKAYEFWITNGEGQYLLKDLHELRGKRLGCFCKTKSTPNKKCHGDILKKLVENEFI